MGDIQFNGTPEEWDALVKKNKEQGEPKQDRTCTHNCSVVCGECQILDLKQKTLEEAAENWLFESEEHDNQLSFIKGANWQAKRMYSEEDMAEAFIACWKVNVPNGIECKVSFNEWFEQFKKK